MFFTVEHDFDPMSIDLSGRTFAKTIAKDSGSIGVQRNTVSVGGRMPP
jgi:hypothetical protein